MSLKVTALLLFIGISEIYGAQYNTETFTINPHASRDLFTINDKEFFVFNVGKPNLTVELYERRYYGHVGISSISSRPYMNQEFTHGSFRKFSIRRSKVTVMRVTNRADEVGFMHAFSWYYQFPEYDYFDQPHFNIDKSDIAQTAVKVSAAYLPIVGTLLEGLVELFWPLGGSVFEEINDEVKELIDQSTEETVKKLLMGDIDQLRERIERCSREVDNPNITQTTDNHFINIAEDIIGLERKFTFEFFLLPLFSTVVNLKLKFYQFGLLNKEKIGLHQEHMHRLVDYINYTVHHPSRGAIAHVNNICKEKLDYVYTRIYPEYIFDTLASTRAFCALYGYENIPIWEQIASISEVKKVTEIPSVVFSTQFGRNTAQQSSIMVVDPIAPPLQPKVINGKLNKPKSLRVYLTSAKRIANLKIFYENGDTVSTGGIYLEGFYKTVDFKGKKLMKLIARGSGKIDALEFIFEDGRIERAGTPNGNTHTFSLEKHHIVGFFMTTSLRKGLDPDQAANIAVSYQAILE